LLTTLEKLGQSWRFPTGPLLGDGGSARHGSVTKTQPETIANHQPDHRPKSNPATGSLVT
jgi:hypothetical protein